MHWHSSCFGSCSVFQRKSLCYTFFTWLTVDIRVDIKILINPCTLTGGIFSWSFFLSSFCWCSFPYHHPPLFFLLLPRRFPRFSQLVALDGNASVGRAHIFPASCPTKLPIGLAQRTFSCGDETKNENAIMLELPYTRTHTHTCVLVHWGPSWLMAMISFGSTWNMLINQIPGPSQCQCQFGWQLLSFFFGFLVFPAWMTANCWAGVFFLGSAHHFASCNFKPFSKSWPTEQASVSVESQTFVIHVLAVSGIGFAASDNSQKGRLKP